MIVKCLHKNLKRDENLRALTINALYLVVTIAYENNKIWYGLLNNNSVYALYESDHFEIVDARIPPDYIMEFFKVTDDYYLCYWEPKEFKGNFWEEDYREDPKYIKIYKDTIRRIKEFHNWPVTEDDYYHELEKELAEHEWWKDPKNWEK